MTTDVPGNVPLNAGLGPLPEAGKVVSEPPAFYKDDWKHHKFYTAEQMRSYAAQERAAERERICAAIKAEDDYMVNRDYMLDSDDCIKVARGQWVRPE